MKSGRGLPRHLKAVDIWEQLHSLSVVPATGDDFKSRDPTKFLKHILAFFPLKSALHSSWKHRRKQEIQDLPCSSERRAGASPGRGMGGRRTGVSVLCPGDCVYIQIGVKPTQV